MQEGMCWQQPWLERSVCLIDLTFLTVGQVFSYYHTTCPYTSLSFHTSNTFPQHLTFAFLLCNKCVADCSHSLFPSPFSRCFPHYVHLKRPNPFWNWSNWQSHQQKDQHVRGLHNKIIFALGCWNSGATPWQFHSPREREKKENGNLAQTCTLGVLTTLYVITEIL